MDIMDTIPYRLEPSFYIEQVKAKGGTREGFIQAWEQGLINNMDQDYVDEILETWKE